MNKKNRPKKPNDIDDVNDWLTKHHDWVAKKEDMQSTIDKIDGEVERLRDKLSEWQDLKNQADDIMDVYRHNLNLHPDGVKEIRETYTDWDEAIETLEKFWTRRILVLSGINRNDDTTRFFFQGEGKFDTRSILRTIATVGGSRSIQLGNGDDNGYVWVSAEIGEYIKSIPTDSDDLTSDSV